MKKLLFILFLITTISQSAQSNISFFDGKTFELKYFLKDEIREDFDFTHHQGRGTRDAPILNLSYNSTTNYLEINTDGYCNSASITYNNKGDYLEYISGGASSLADCGSDEDTDFYNHISTLKIYYKLTEDQKGLWLWSDENHKLFFSEKVLSVEENQLEKLIVIHLNPTKDFINIDVKSIVVKIKELVIFDYQGKKILKKENDINKINISKLAKGVYFLKLKSETGVSISKKIVKE